MATKPRANVGWYEDDWGQRELRAHWYDRDAQRPVCGTRLDRVSVVMAWESTEPCGRCERALRARGDEKLTREVL